MSLHERLCSVSISVEQNILALKNTTTWFKLMFFWPSFLINCEIGNDLCNTRKPNITIHFKCMFSKIMFCLKKYIKIFLYLHILYLVLFDSEVRLNMFCQYLKESVS